jgi:hypothetical protein
MNLTFTEFYKATWFTTMGAEPIFLSTRMLQKDERKNHGKWGKSKPFPWLVAFITDRLDGPHEDSMSIGR